MPQLIATQSGARPTCEPTIASTTQMLNPETREWDRALLDRLDLPTEPLPELEQSGTTVGTLDTGDVDIALPASHDTAFAVVDSPLVKTPRRSSLLERGSSPGSNWMLLS